MQLPNSPKVAVAALTLLFLMAIASSVSLAKPAPTLPQFRNAVQSNAPQGQYKLYLPMVGTQSSLKKGVGLTYSGTAVDGGCSNVTNLSAFWEFDWSTTPQNCPNVENVPMIWGALQVDSTLGGNSQWIMGFNEPDQASQANLTPSVAAGLWRRIEQKYPTRKLLSPATGQDPNWLVNFRNAYLSAYGTAPRLDGLAMHCFRWWASQCIDDTQQIINWANSWGVSEVWVTEFSFAMDPSCGFGASQSQAIQMQQTYINWISAQPIVTRYAWFASKMQGTEWWVVPCFATPLLDYTSGIPTAYGNAYLQFH